MNTIAPVTTVISFLLVLTRVASVFIFVPVPGARNVIDAAKIVFSLCVTIALFPFWPVLSAAEMHIGRVITWLVAEAGFGLPVGVIVSMLAEAFVLAAQIFGLQAGFSYASTIDPNTQADSTILQSLAQLLAGMLFFSIGLERWVVATLARSLQSLGPGVYLSNDQAFEAVCQVGTVMFTTGLRLALPVVVLLVIVDIALAVLGRFAAQLQLLSLSMPLKMLAAVGALAIVIRVAPTLYEQAAGHSIRVLSGVVR